MVMRSGFDKLAKIFLLVLLLLFLFWYRRETLAADSEITVTVNPADVKNNDFGQILGGYINTRANLDPSSKIVLSQNSLINEAKKMFPQSPEFPSLAVMRTQDYPMLDNDHFVISNSEVEDIIKFCSQAGCDPMFGAVGEGSTETINGMTGKIFDYSPAAIKARASFVKQKCQQYFGDNSHCLHWDIGNEPPSTPGSCTDYGTNLIPNSMRAVKEIIPSAIFHTPELFLDSATVRSSSETIGECIARTFNSNSPDLKIDVFTTHWYPYVCSGTPLNITGETVLNWAGNGGPAYQKITYPKNIVSGMSSWLRKYPATQGSVIGIGELNPMGNCTDSTDSTRRLNLTWGGAFWHLDVLGIMAEEGIKYSQKHIHISGGGGTYEAIVFANNVVSKTPSYYAYRFYSQYFGHKIVGSQSSNPTTLNSHASIDKDGNLRLLLINKSRPATPQRVNISLSNFNAANIGAVYVMKIPTYSESPPGFNPENPLIYSTINNVPVGNNFDYTVPEYSAVIIKVPRQGGSPTDTPGANPTSTPGLNQTPSPTSIPRLVCTLETCYGSCSNCRTNCDHYCTRLTGDDARRICGEGWDSGYQCCNLGGAPCPTSQPEPTNTPRATGTPGSCSCPTGANIKPKSQGNANCDNAVDIRDYNLWLPQFHSSLDPDQMKCADFNGDRKVDGIDFEYWRRGKSQ